MESKFIERSPLITANLKILFTVILSVFCNLTSKAQDDQNSGRFKSVSIKGMSGAHLYSGEDLSEKVQYGYGAMNIRFAWEPNKDNHWTRETGFAAYGFGYYTASIGDPQVFGNPHALFAFANFYLSKAHRRNVLEISPALGLTYNLEPFNPDSNPLNDAIGARMAVYFNVNFGGAFRMNREMDVLYGIDFTHYSNGRTYTPNYGLNLFGFNLGLRYHFNQMQAVKDSDPYTTNVVPARFKRPEKFKNQPSEFKNSIDLYAAIGTVQNYEDAGTDIRYGTFSGVVDYRHYFDTMHGTTVGMDLFYDASLAEYYNDSKDYYLIGVHAGYDFMFWRLNIRVQLGTYLTDDRMKDNLFIRPAIHYKISKSLFAQVGLKTRNGPGADWIEFGFGWKPFKW